MVRLILICACSFTTIFGAHVLADTAGGQLADIRHVFVIVLENEGFDSTFGPASPAPYLATELAPQGALLNHYYGIGHFSLDNYIAMISGQAPNPATQSDCHGYVDFVASGISADGQAVGQGCIYPRDIKTIADQLQSVGLSWKAYMEDLGNDPLRENSTCGRPKLGTLAKISLRRLRRMTNMRRVIIPLSISIQSLISPYARVLLSISPF